MEEELKQRKALEMYDAGKSMREIQQSCGQDVTVAKIRQWGHVGARPKAKKRVPKKHKSKSSSHSIVWAGKKPRHTRLKKQKKKKRKTKALKQEIKQFKEKERRKRIFASWKNPELDKLRKTEEYRVWRIAVVERDEYTCQHCEKTGGRLHAHHIKTFKMHEELRYEVSNGVTLCGKCHEDLHIANVDRKPFVIKMKAV